ncbi:RDD family protein [Paenibacillus luteus]|uniref:RDD family protein n=1 Tax=Paenibacillus luteus TaxID=2545753 RepID=UPI001144EB41|nr:RDD family protein [Paenibacillus luteus]
MNAGFWIRFGAGLLDGIIVGIPLAVISLLISGSMEGSNYITESLSFLYSLLIPVFWKGFTIGKRICGIKIQKLDGTPPGIGTMLLRHLLCSLIYAVTLGIAAIVSAFMVGLREDKRAIHDLIAGTEVVYSE